eukprot:16341-Heterococcus_DN1.PRE.5
MSCLGAQCIPSEARLHAASTCALLYIQQMNIYTHKTIIDVHGLRDAAVAVPVLIFDVLVVGVLHVA